ncbi:cytochrome b5 type B, isoform CRA_c [Rattus norvegicus]|uniref:Cytochrome b5 type B, isoform CRA_c n=1 Tax=Rattus norvegicus TaxID=10116 RepID=A6IYZ5_RAT|nr:cytochrome b5 type B, isoform CRA_c [Rattus norvegicus]
MPSAPPLKGREGLCAGRLGSTFEDSQVTWSIWSMLGKRKGRECGMGAFQPIPNLMVCLVKTPGIGN